MVDHLKKYNDECENFERQRRAWLRISGFVAIAILIIIADWGYVQNNKHLWILFSAGTVLSLVWWYWTMMVIRRLLTHQQAITSIMIEMFSAVKEVKETMRQDR
jgi:ABC-type bacteriocin/lantibiotic exporter with double-glycine peptidase domain